MNNKKKIAVTFIFLLAMVFFMTPQAISATPEWCEKQWVIESADIYDQESPDYKVLLKNWQQHEKKCAGTVAFEARLAFAYLQLNQVNKAREVLMPIRNKSSNYSFLVDFALLHAEVLEVEAGKTISLEDVRQFEKKYLEYVKKYPDFPDAFAMLGGYQMFLGKYNEAIRSLQIGTRTTMNPATVYRNLTISYTAVGQYQDALKASGKAVKFNRKLTSDPNFAYALAKTDAALGDFQSAQTVLKVILAKVPEVKTTAEFRETLEFVIHEIDKKQVK